MDPVCHTLVGASLAATGLKDKTRFGTATLIIAANLPDIDVAAHFWGDVASYEFRRGWTHGLPAMVILPLLLAGFMFALGRVRTTQLRPQASLRWLTLLSVVGVLSHPALDWLNVYGMRWLMPFVDRWFYGDTLYIIDLAAWSLLAAGLLATRLVNWRALPMTRRPATIALTVLVAYIGMNFGITQYAERTVRAEFQATPPVDFMASPVPLNPLRRDIVLEYEHDYRFASFRAFGSPRLEKDDLVIPKGPAAAFAGAARSDNGAVFLHWARFPYVVVEERSGRPAIRLADARYVRDIDNPRLGGFGTVELDIAPASELATGSRPIPDPRIRR